MKQKIRNIDSSLLALIALLIVVIMIGSVLAESGIAGNENNNKISSTNSNMPSFEKEIELKTGESVKVENLEIMLENLSLIKTNPFVYQATIKYGLLPEGLNKPVKSINLVEGGKKLTQLFPSDFTIFFKSVEDNGEKAKFVISLKRSYGDDGIIKEGVKVSLEPLRTIQSDGVGEFKVTVKDLNKFQVCKTKPCPADISLLAKTKYTLEFESKDDTTGQFSKSELELGLGQEETVTLTVKSEEKGAHPFIVTVKNGDIKSSVKGVLIVGEEILPPEGNAYFFGTGFVLNSDETKGQIVELKVLNDGNSLSGKLNLEKGQPYRIEGTISDSLILFGIFKVDSKEKIGSFSGTIKKFDGFLLLKGDLILNDETSKLIVISRKNLGIKDFETSSNEKVTGTTKVKELIVVKKTVDSAINSENGEVYVRTVEVRKQKIFGIFPTGKKVVDVEVIDGEKITRKAIKEKSKEKIGNYNVEVGSLDDEENIDINVEKAA